MAATSPALPFQIGIASRSATVGLTDVTKVVAALNLQVTRDFAPLWNISATIVALPNPDSIDPGIWPIFIEDDIGADALGFHYTQNNQPFARVSAGATWSLAASHECLEMLADPTGNRLYPSHGITIADGAFAERADVKFEYLVEVCDPCQDESCAYQVNDVMVADFYTPAYFDPVVIPGARYGFSGRVVRPRQICAGGYLSWLDPATGQFHQARWFDRPEIIKLDMQAKQATGQLATHQPAAGEQPTNRPLRGLVDRQMPQTDLSALDPGSKLSLAQDARQSWIGVAASTRAAQYRPGTTMPKAAVASLLGAGRPRTEADIAALLAAHRASIGVPGVISARPGWRMTDGWLDSTRAIVVIAEPAQAATLRMALPPAIEGVPVDVRAASPQQLLRHTKPSEYAAVASGPRQEYALPDFDGEILFNADSTAALAAVMATRARKQQLDYELPPGVSLEPIEEEMTLDLHASPDAGWQLLKPFLEQATDTLVVGMYDFTAPHIEKALLDGRGQGGRLDMTLDHPPGKSTREQTIDTTHDDLEALGGRLRFAWALEGHDPKASAFLFPNAYHIKVAVRPDDVMWLSSGNWNTSNQPQIDLSNRDGAIATAQKSDRDWHVIAHSPGLSSVFRTVLEADLAIAADHQEGAPPPGLAALTVETIPPELLALDAAKPAPTVTFFPPLSITGRRRVRPLLTPKDFQKPILELIKGATTRFWMQTQYIKPSGRAGDEDHDALIAALVDRQKAGIDLRLITSTFETADLIEKLMNAGLDQAALRLQPQMHNKGMLVDSRHVVISSQNWSADGTLRNRDAGLIIYDSPDAAAYFEQIFLHDWAHLARAKVAGTATSSVEDGEG